MLHCVKSGFPIAVFAEGKTAGAIANLNAMLSSGRLVAGVSTGRLFISDEALLEHCNKHGMAKPKHLFWGGYKATGWKQGPGQRVGLHNEQVLKTFGLNADPATLTKGATSKRQYGVYEEAKPKATPKQPVDMPMLGQPTVATVANVKAPKKEAELLDTALRSLGERCPVPSPEEMKGTGSYGKFIGNRKKLGFTRSEANDAWRIAKDAQSTTVSTPPQPKVESIQHVTIAKRKPQPKPAKQGTTLHVPAAALQALLSSIGEAKVDYNPADNTFTVVTL